MTIVDMVGKYYRWFNVSSKPLKDNLVLEFIDEDLKKSYWIDSMKCQISLRKKALHELILWLETTENEEDIDHGMVHYTAIYIMSHQIAQISIILTKFSLIFQKIIYFTMTMRMSI